jgi:hypothetical protein
MTTNKQEDAVSSRLRRVAGLTACGVFFTDLHRGDMNNE